MRWREARIAGDVSQTERLISRGTPPVERLAYQAEAGAMRIRDRGTTS